MAFNPLAALLAARGGQPPNAQAGPQPGAEADGTQGVVQLVNRMIDLGQQAVQAERDPIEREGLSKIVALLHGFAAREQKQKDAAMGAGPAVQMLRRQG